MLTPLLLALTAPFQAAPAAPAAPSHASSSTTRNFVITPGAFAPASVTGDYYDVLLRLPEGHEYFGLYVPPNPAPDAPLLVHFHAYNFNHWDQPAFAPEWLDEAASRNWYSVAVTQVVPGSVTTTYGNEEAQRRYTGILDWMFEQFPDIDEERIYAYGFSMGGGDVLSYAAQHLDPTRPMFAAIATNGPTAGLVKEFTANPSSQPAMQAAMGGAPPQSSIYPYWAASTLLYDVNEALLPGTHPIHNIQDVPLWLWQSGNEPPSIATQCDDLVFTLSGAPSFMSTLNGNSHSWGTFRPAQICDWFEPLRRTIPIRGDLVVARDARYYDLTLSRRDPNALGRVSFDLNAGFSFAGSRLTFEGIENLGLVEVDGSAHGIGVASTSADIDVERPVRDVAIRIDGWSQMPTSVHRNGAPADPATWQYANGALTILTRGTSTNPGPPTDTWRIR